MTIFNLKLLLFKIGIVKFIECLLLYFTCFGWHWISLIQLSSTHHMPNIHTISGTRSVLPHHVFIRVFYPISNPAG